MARVTLIESQPAARHCTDRNPAFDHKVAYVPGRVHTNDLENFWSLLKRGLHGTYVAVAPKHLIRDVDERVFTFNERDLADLGRFFAGARPGFGAMLTHESLTAMA